jgi:hypothetical protein
VLLSSRFPIGAGVAWWICRCPTWRCPPFTTSADRRGVASAGICVAAGAGYLLYAPPAGSAVTLQRDFLLSLVATGAVVAVLALALSPGGSKGKKN